MYQILTLLTLLVFAGGCGSQHATAQKEEILPDTHAKTFFGALANATVTIRELGKEDEAPLFTEHTSAGKTLDEIGNFDPHLRHMQRQKRYLLEVRGGMNYDSDRDGEIDETPAPNTTVYRTVYQGYRPKIAWWGTGSGRDNRAPSEK
ncbi:MAG TPA: hypothetical protein ENK93_04420 [Campylobacteraceae bacterium]|jgi:hypothetical protein|nr:hypothetical protein [Campylobacteraceae bacterium]